METKRNKNAEQAQNGSVSFMRMLPKLKRLKTEDFKVSLKTDVIHAPHFLLRLSNGEIHGKAAVIVSSSTYKRAVDRNLLRRRVYDIIGKHYPLLNERTLKVILKKGALAASFRELEQEFLKAIELARLKAIG